MAITWLETGATFSSSPQFIRQVGYEETGRTATTATYKIYLRLKLNHSTTASYYGYPMSWTVGGASAGSIKGSEKWYGGQAYREFTYTYKKSSISAGGGSFSLNIAVTSSSGGSASFSKSYTLSYSTFNTAPYWASTAKISVKQTNSSGAVLATTGGSGKYFPENVSSLYVYWDSASDANNNISKYQVDCQINDGAWSTVYTGANRYFTHNIGSGASTQGKKYEYVVKAIDSYNLSSPFIGHPAATKNTLTGAALTVGSGITYSTGSVSISFSGAKNTDGNTSFTYTLSSPQLTVYNPKVTGTTTLTIYKSGDVPSTPYIKFTDLKALFKSSSWRGSFSLVLTTKNAYGSSKTSTKSVSVDLRTNPKAPTASLGGRSTILSTLMYVSKKSTCVVNWSGASDYLGGSLTYDVQYQINDGSWTNLVTGTTASSASLTAPTVSAASTISFRVKAITSFGYYLYSPTVSCPLHYHNAPKVTFGTPTRAETSHQVTVTSKVDTSISGAAISSQSYTGFTGTATTFSGASYTIKEEGLTASSAYTLSVTVSDNTGLTGNSRTATLSVTAQLPILSIREKGVGIGAVNTGSKGKLLDVDGGINVRSKGLVVESGGLSVNAGATQFSGSTTANGSLTVGGNTTLSGSGARLGITSANLCSSGYSKLDINTSGDSNGVGNGKTLIAYNNNGAYNHYLRGKGTTYLDTVGGAVVTSTLLTKGIATFDHDIKMTDDRAVYFSEKNDARIGYSSSGQCVYIANGNANWLRLNDDATLTWKGIHLVQANGGVKMTGDLCWSSGATVQADNGIAVLRSNNNDIAYLQGSAARVTAPKTSTTYRPILASAFTVSSQTKHKQDITPIEQDEAVNSMEILKSTEVYTYRLKDEIENGVDKKKIGLIVEQATCDLTDYEEEGIDLYQMASTLWDVCKKQQESIEELQKQIEELKGDQEHGLQESSN